MKYLTTSRLLAFCLFTAGVFAFIACTKDAEEEEAGKPTFIDRQPNYEEWPHTDPENLENFAGCEGIDHSPINIDQTDVIKKDLPNFQFNLNPFLFKIVDNGNNIMVKKNGLNSITYNGETFTFQQLHFHAHSEHQIDGNYADMEMHMVFQNTQTEYFVVFGVMLTPSDTGNQQIATIFDNLPAEKNTEELSSTHIYLNELLPTSKLFYTYLGAHISSPCSPGVQWYIFKDPIAISHTNYQQFNALYPESYRPLKSNANLVIHEDLN